MATTVAPPPTGPVEAPLTLDEPPRRVLGLADQTVLWGNLGVSLLLPVTATFILTPDPSVAPLSLGAALVWGRNVRIGSWYVTALCLNWLLGAVSYYLVPSLGPVFVDPPLADQMPATAVWNLQQVLLVDRVRFIDDPMGSEVIQSIAGFASLHVSVLFTAALMAWLLRARRVLQISLWALLGLTVLATIYFGWHYVVDDLAGVVMAIVVVYVAAPLTGWRIERRRASHSPPRQVTAEAT